jgi:Leucine-rich repeat (LRR) protein
MGTLTKFCVLILSLISTCFSGINPHISTKGTYKKQKNGLLTPVSPVRMTYRNPSIFPAELFYHTLTYLKFVDQYRLVQAMGTDELKERFERLHYFLNQRGHLSELRVWEARNGKTALLEILDPTIQEALELDLLAPYMNHRYEIVFKWFDIDLLVRFLQKPLKLRYDYSHSFYVDDIEIGHDSVSNDIDEDELMEKLESNVEMLHKLRNLSIKELELGSQSFHLDGMSAFPDSQEWLHLFKDDFAFLLRDLEILRLTDTFEDDLLMFLIRECIALATQKTLKLRSLSFRKFIFNEEICNALVELLSHPGNTITEFVIEDGNFYNVSRLFSIKRLSFLTLQNINIDDVDVTEFAPLLPNSNLKVLVLDFNDISFNGLEEILVNANNDLKSLSLSYNNITEFFAIDSVPGLETLNLGSNALGGYLEEFTNWLIRSKVSNLFISNNQLNDEEVAYFFSKLHQTKVKELDLSQNSVGAFGEDFDKFDMSRLLVFECRACFLTGGTLKTISRSNISNLRTLSLRFNFKDIQPELSDVLKNLNVLDYLDLSSNPISIDHLKALNKVTIDKLDMERCEMNTEFDKIVRLNVKILNLKNNRINDKDLYHALRHIRHLNFIDLKYNALTTAGSGLICKYMRANSRLVGIDVGGNAGISYNVLRYIILRMEKELPNEKNLEEIVRMFLIEELHGDGPFPVYLSGTVLQTYRIEMN